MIPANTMEISTSTAVKPELYRNLLFGRDKSFMSTSYGLYTLIGKEAELVVPLPS